MSGGGGARPAHGGVARYWQVKKLSSSTERAPRGPRGGAQNPLKKKKISRASACAPDPLGLPITFVVCRCTLFVIQLTGWSRVEPP